MKRRPCCFSKPVLWELSSFCISKLLFVAINIGIAADNVRQNAPIQNCLGFWIFNVDSISVKLGFQIPIVSGISDSLSTILDSKAQDFWFQKEEFPVFPWNPGYLACLGRYRLQNSPYSCVFKYARVVEQKVWNEAEKRERHWGETLFSRPTGPPGVWR